MDTSLEKDLISRGKIVSEINRNFFVEAGAGSGKTKMLVSRMVAMVESGIDISRICAITFTKAAAGEFYERFQKQLIDRSRPDYVWNDSGEPGQLPEPTELSKQRCREALRNIDLCFMGTIDSFCSMVLSEHPSEAGIPADSVVVDDETGKSIYKQVFVSICAGKFGQELQELSKRFREVTNNSENLFADCMKSIMENRNARLNYKETVARDIGQAYKEEKAELIRLVSFLRDHRGYAYEGNKDSVGAWERLNYSLTDIRKSWNSSFNNMLYALKSLSSIGIDKKFRDEKDFSDSVEEKNQRCLGIALLGKDRNILKELKEYQYSVSMMFFEKCIPVLEDTMREKGCMTFFDALYYLREMLRKDAMADGKLIKYIYDRHSYFLIDEFQDTNPLQAEVFFYLASENPVPDWRLCVPRPGSIFIVGDPKQSIYRFRSADVTSFLKVRSLFTGDAGEVLTLSRNFRSTNEMCRYFNDTFSRLLDVETENQSKFELIPLKTETENEFQGVYKYDAIPNPDPDASDEPSDPECILRIISTLVDNDEYLITTPGDASPRKIRYDDIMVITMNKASLGPIMACLNGNGIDTRVEGRVLFSRNEALNEISKIYKAVSNTDDEISLYGALTGRIFGLSDRELLIFRNAGGKITLKNVPSEFEKRDEDSVKVSETLGCLRRFMYENRILSPAALFSKTLDSFRVFMTSCFDNLEVVYYTLELLRNAEKSGAVTSAKETGQYIDTLMADAPTEERCLSLKEERNAVHLANLHKVKGLEAPVVILAQAGVRSVVPKKRIIYGDTTEGYFFSPHDKDDKQLVTGAFEDEYKDEKDALTAENIRLLYVAATRARNALIINGKDKRNRWGDIIPEHCRNFFDCVDLRDPKMLEKKALDPAALYRDADETSVLNGRKVEAPTYVRENPSKQRAISKITDDNELMIVSVLQSSETRKISSNSAIHRFPDLLGTMVHRLMEILVSSGNTVDASKAIEEIINEYHTPQSEPYDSEFRMALIEVADKMRNGGYSQVNSVPQDLLATLLKADEVYCEMPFCYVEDTEEGRVLWNGVIDVVYLENGKWHIVDYKTNADGNNLDIKYYAQLAAYVRAFQNTTRETADAFTYHIHI